MKKLIKLLCLVLYYTVAIHFPTQPMPGWRFGYWLRGFLLKGIADYCGDQILVKHNCYIGSGIGLKVGNRAQLGHNARIDRLVTIGDDVVMGPDVIIMTNAHAFEDPDIPINRQGALPLQPVTIGRDVWLGTRAIIMPGVTIGEGSVIGAGSIVTKDVPPYSVAVGVPAHVVKKRGKHSQSAPKQRDK